MNIEELIKNKSSDIIESLIRELLANKHVEVRFDFFDQDQWAIVSINQYEDDREISLRLHPNSLYELVIGYYDDEDEFFEVVNQLTPDEVDSIPMGLKKIMTKVVGDEQGLRVASELLTPKTK